MSIQSCSKMAAAVDRSVASLAVVVPSYNEESAVGDTVADIRSTMAAHGVSYVVILVDDGSTDDTPVRLAELMADEPAATLVVTHPRNLGLGRAIASGYAAATATSWVGWLPADGQFNAEDLYELYAARSGKDVVVGRVRTLTRGRADSFGRVVVSWMSRAIMRLLHPRMPRFNGIMVVRRDRIATERLVCRTEFVNMEILDRLRREQTGCGIAEREVRVMPRRSGHSKVANLRTTFAVLRDLLALRIDYLLQPSGQHTGPPQ